jgi:hypothetical protein
METVYILKILAAKSSVSDSCDTELYSHPISSLYSIIMFRNFNHVAHYLTYGGNPTETRTILIQKIVNAIWVVRPTNQVAC